MPPYLEMVKCMKGVHKLTIKLELRKKIFTFDKPLSLKQALIELQLPSDSYLAMRNGELITEDQILKHGDEIKLIAVISGG